MSVTTARKERERAVREELILDHGLRLLLRGGYQNLNLDELATAIEYSKGTIYLHFQTKEDLVLGIATRAMERNSVNFFASWAVCEVGQPSLKDALASASGPSVLPAATLPSIIAITSTSR